jgi:hypothetical protein
VGRDRCDRKNEADQLHVVTARVLSGVATRILFAKLAVTAVTIQQAAHLLKTLAKAFKRPRSTPPPTHFASAAARIHMPHTAAQLQRDDENTVNTIYF